MRRLCGWLRRLIARYRRPVAPPVRLVVVQPHDVRPGRLIRVEAGHKLLCRQPRERVLADVLADMRRRAAVGRRAAWLVEAPRDRPSVW